MAKRKNFTTSEKEVIDNTTQRLLTTLYAWPTSPRPRQDQRRGWSPTPDRKIIAIRHHEITHHYITHHTTKHAGQQQHLSYMDGTVVAGSTYIRRAGVAPSSRYCGEPPTPSTSEQVEPADHLNLRRRFAAWVYNNMLRSRQLRRTCSAYHPTSQPFSVSLSP